MIRHQPPCFGFGVRLSLFGESLERVHPSPDPDTLVMTHELPRIWQ